MKSHPNVNNSFFINLEDIVIIATIDVLQFGHQNKKVMSFQNIRACKRIWCYQVWFGRYHHYSYYIKHIIMNIVCLGYVYKFDRTFYF